MQRYTEVVNYQDLQNFFDRCPNEFWKRRAKGLYYTASRESELIEIKGEDIKQNEEFIQVRLHTRKNPHAPIRYIPISITTEPDALSIFGEVSSKDSPLFPSYNSHIALTSYLRVMRRKFNEYWGVAPHYFRHARLTHMVTQFDFNDQELVKYAGWSDSKPAKWYVSLKTTDLLKKMVKK